MIGKFYSKSLEQYHDLVASLGGIDNLDTTKHSLKDIIDREQWQTVWEEYWTTKILYTCARVCGKSTDNFSKPKDQFIKRVSN